MRPYELQYTDQETLIGAMVNKEIGNADELQSFLNPSGR
jgi:hypothetical protein